jgi:hypothetical protein
LNPFPRTSEVVMPDRSNKMISDFAAKARTQAQYLAIDEFVMGLGPVKRSATSQVSYSVNR